MTDDIVALLRHEQELCAVMGDTKAGALVGQAADRLEAAEARVRELEAELAEAYERAASKCEELQQVFLSDEYAFGQPQSSFGERYACGRCAEEVRQLAQVKHETE